jgi:hypothetical protein
VSELAHPAPRRHDASFAQLAFCTIAAPAVWGLRLVINYGIASYFCFPGDTPRQELPGNLGWIWPTLLALDLASIAVALAGAAIAFQLWRSTRHELAVPGSPLIEVGEDRTRFLSLWGLMISLGFFVAVVFELVALWVVPICG